MNERLLQFIWQHLLFRTGPYFTNSSKCFEIIDRGHLNFNQGPDFLNARIRFQQTEWIGNIEIHVLSSDWYRHGHDSDLNFRNIILHVVWMEDMIIFDQSGTPIETFCIQPYVSIHLLGKFRNLMEGSNANKPCQYFFPDIEKFSWELWKERLVVERLDKKAKRIQQLLSLVKQDWETVTWWLLANNMGISVNKLLFENMAKSISLKIIANHRNQIIQLEALLMGQTNLLDDSYSEQYPILLQKEFRHLRKKYGLIKIYYQPAFLRMRPAAFPSIRLAQLAMILHKNDHLFDLFKNNLDLLQIRKSLIVEPNDYWLYHYRFDEPGNYIEKSIGQTMFYSILINTMIPLLYTYGFIKKEISFQEMAIQLLIQLPPENNKITNNWHSMQITNKNAFDSQALLELHNNYCLQKKCLSCFVGTKILGSNKKLV